jgi:hypothetical protein
MVNADTIYPLIAVTFYVLLLLRATSKQIRQLILAWWHRLLGQILPAAWKIISSKWVWIPGIPLMLLSVGYYFIFNGNAVDTTSNSPTGASYSFSISENEDFISLNQWEQAELKESFKEKLKRKYGRKLASKAKSGSYNAIQIVTFREDEMMDFDIEIDYDDINISEEIMYALKSEEGLDSLIWDWVPMDVPMPILPTGSSYPIFGKEGFRVEFRLFHATSPEPEVRPNCDYKGQSKLDRTFYLRLDDEKLCERKISNFPNFKPKEELQGDESELVVIEVDACIDAEGRIQQMEMEIIENPRSSRGESLFLKWPKALLKN